MASLPSGAEGVGGQAGADFPLPAEQAAEEVEGGGWVRSRGEEEGEKECGARVMLVLDSRATPRDVRAGCTEANVSGRNFPPA